MKIITLCFLAILLLANRNGGYAQDIPVTIQKFTDGILQMPSQAGASGGSAFVGYRKANDMAGAPSVQVAGAHGLIAKNRIGIGLTTFADQINIVRNASVNMVLAYHLPISSKATASFGINSEYHYFSLNTDQLNAAVNLQDPMVVDFQPSTRLDFSPGLAINHKKYWVGITLNRLRTLMDSEPKRTYMNGFYTSFAGYRYHLNPKNLIEPLVIVRYNPVQKSFQNDFQLFYTYNQSIVAGITYRGAGVLAASAGYIFSKRLVLGYSYQFMTSAQSSVYHANSHEISIRFNFNKQYYNQPMFLPDQRPASDVTKEKLK